MKLSAGEKYLIFIRKREAYIPGKEDEMKKRILMMMTVVMMGACLVVGCSGDKEKESGSQETQQSQEQQSGAVTEGVGSQQSGMATEGAGQQEPGTATEGAGQQESSAAVEEDVQVSKMTGTLDEVKDFMFVITDETGVSYAFAFEQKPEGLEKLSLGDKIVVTYTGTVSVVDAFLGEIISVEKVL